MIQLRSQNSVGNASTALRWNSSVYLEAQRVLANFSKQKASERIVLPAPGGDYFQRCVDGLMASSDKVESPSDPKDQQERFWDEQTGLHLALDKPTQNEEADPNAPKPDLNQRLEEAARKAQETLGQASEQVRKRFDKLSTLVSALYEEDGTENTRSEKDTETPVASAASASSGFLESWRSFSEFVSAHMSLKETSYPFLEKNQEKSAGTGTRAAADTDNIYAKLLESDDMSSLQTLYDRYFSNEETRDMATSPKAGPAASKDETAVETEAHLSQRVVDSYRIELVQRYRCIHNDLTPERRFHLPGRLFITKTHVAFLSSLEAAYDFAEPRYETDIQPGFIRHEPIRCSVALADVSKVQRGKGMNLRLVTKTEQQYIFGSFRSQVEFEAALSMIEHTWRSVQLREKLQETESDQPSGGR